MFPERNCGIYDVTPRRARQPMALAREESAGPERKATSLGIKRSSGRPGPSSSMRQGSSLQKARRVAKAPSTSEAEGDSIMRKSVGNSSGHAAKERAAASATTTCADSSRISAEGAHVPLRTAIFTKLTRLSGRS